MKTKQLKAGWDNRYLEDVLNALNIVTIWSLVIIEKRVRFPCRAASVREGINLCSNRVNGFGSSVSLPSIVAPARDAVA